MRISFENADKVNGLLTITVEEADYRELVEKTLKDYRKKVNVPGFRPGQVPMGLVKRQYGTAVKAEEVNKLVGNEIYKYVQENNIRMLGEPMPNESQAPVDLENDAEMTFAFDIAIAPDFKIDLTGKDKLPYYQIKVDDKLRLTPLVRESMRKSRPTVPPSTTCCVAICRNSTRMASPRQTGSVLKGL